MSNSESGSGGWTTYHGFWRKTPPQKRFWTPHLRYVSPPLWRLSVISLKRKRHRPDHPQFLTPPKVVLESTLCSTFPPPPPPKFAWYVLPPPQPLPNSIRIARIEFATPIFSSQGFALLCFVNRACSSRSASLRSRIAANLILSRCPSTVSRTVWKRKRVNSRRIFLVSPTEKQRKHACVRVQIEYGFSCFQVRFEQFLKIARNEALIRGRYGEVERRGGRKTSERTPLPNSVRAARVQNEFAPEKFLNRYEKREKGSEKRSETRLKKILALSGLLKIFHRPFFTKF